MSPTVATVQAETRHGRVLVSIAGEIDLDNADVVEEDLVAAIPNDTHAVTVDVNDVSYIDSIGLRILFMLAARLRTAQIEFSVAARPGSLARRVIDLSGLAAVVPIDGETSGESEP
jgi:anti-anti-sigma factor